jgi:hypothetical protein
MNSPRCARTLSKWLLERVDAFDYVAPSAVDQIVMNGPACSSVPEIIGFFRDVA